MTQDFIYTAIFLLMPSSQEVHKMECVMAARLWLQCTYICLYVHVLYLNCSTQIL